MPICGLLLLARTAAAASMIDALPAFALVGAQAPVGFVPTTVATMEALQDRSGLASGLFNTSQQLGDALALAALATTAAPSPGLRAAGGATEAAALTGGHRAGFLLAAALTLTGALAAWQLPIRSGS